MSGTYQLGQGFKITETFSVDGTPTDPTTVIFSVRDPLNVVTAYTFGVDSEVTNPSVGVYVLTLTPPLVGTYGYSVTGTGAVADVGVGGFTVLQSPTGPQQTPFPQFGPMVPWIDCNDIQANCAVPDSVDATLLNGIAAMASQLMFEISGRQFTGIWERTVRPCQDEQNVCWGAGIAYGWVGWPWAWTWDGSTWGWYDQQGCRCACQALSRVRLPGYPVIQVSEVKIDGTVISSDEYRLDDWQYLVRLRSAATPEIRQFWPACQILDLPDSEPGTWSVTYVSGVAPPLAGKAAAAALACELLPGADCKLPSGATRIVRQGLTIDKLQPLSAMLRAGATGIPQIDTFIAAYNPSGLRRRPTVWSPDGPSYARPVGGV